MKATGSHSKPKGKGPRDNNRSGKRKDGTLPHSAFPKGVSGNPGGRPKDLASFRAMVRERGTEPSLKCLLDGLKVGDVRAAELLLAYGWGRPTQAVELSGPDGGPVKTQGPPLPALTLETARRLRAIADALQPPEAGGAGPAA